MAKYRLREQRNINNFTDKKAAYKFESNSGTREYKQIFTGNKGTRISPFPPWGDSSMKCWFLRQGESCYARELSKRR